MIQLFCLQPPALKSSWWRKFKNGVIVASADAVGAATAVVITKEAAAIIGVATGGTGAVVVLSVAGVLCGAGASFAAHDALPDSQVTEPVTMEAIYTHFDNLDKPKTDVKIVLNFPDRYKFLNSLGTMHNEIMKKEITFPNVDLPPVALRSDPEESDPPGGNDDECGGDTYSGNEAFATVEYMEYERLLLQSETLANDFVALKNFVSQSCENGIFNRQQFIERMDNFTVNEKDVFQLYYDVLMETAENIDDVISIANRYIDVIENSTDISEPEKEKIFINIAISVNSIDFWSKGLN
ncbi:hypothetical protein [Prevotella sp. 10(H)]|uniref:hypothetical protein n=1 Tax=Prevotella sp. 10(H) TaxID=1158294 RepID=UPI0004A7619B|nr:hypothetical protein [Prevotella sp. 10(H)]